MASKLFDINFNTFFVGNELRRHSNCFKEYLHEMLLNNAPKCHEIKYMY